MKRSLVYGAVGGALLALLRYVEYQHFVRVYPTEVYGGVLAAVFLGVGLYFGWRWGRSRRVVVVERVRVGADEPFEPDQAKLAELGITPREHEILLLIAEGLSNREIGERVFISENTVKTHSSRLFGKLDARRRVQAVQRGRELGLIR